MLPDPLKVGVKPPLLRLARVNVKFPPAVPLFAVITDAPDIVVAPKANVIACWFVEEPA